MNKKDLQRNDVILKRLGARVRDARRDKDMSQEGLALEAGLDRSYVGGVERGERNITVINLNKIAHAVGMSLSALLEGV
jgi:transcriptional regulator with XRE-family HTH domain